MTTSASLPVSEEGQKTVRRYTIEEWLALKHLPSDSPDGKETQMPEFDLENEEIYVQFPGGRWSLLVFSGLARELLLQNR